MTLYEPRNDRHPVEPGLAALGNLTLVGSRALHAWPPIATPESDWDYYLVPPVPEDPTKRDYERLGTAFAGAITAMEAMGLHRLPGEGGPYGKDEQIEGIWRLEPHIAYGRDWPGVDVILTSPKVWERRRLVLARIANAGAGGGLMCRGLKTETSWGMFWWVTRG